MPSPAEREGGRAAARKITNGGGEQNKNSIVMVERKKQFAAIHRPQASRPGRVSKVLSVGPEEFCVAPLSKVHWIPIDALVA